MCRHQNTKSKGQKGYATVTFTLTLPVLLLFIAGLYEIVRLLHANSILVNLGRESAHLMSRTSDYTPQNVMDIVATTSNAVDMNSNGIIYISHINGQSDENPYVSEQFKWTQAGIEKNSKLWASCASWQSGECDMPENIGLRELTGFPITMEDNDTVYVVEVYYKYTPLFGFIGAEDVLLSQRTYL